MDCKTFADGDAHVSQPFALQAPAGKESEEDQSHVANASDRPKRFGLMLLFGMLSLFLGCAGPVRVQALTPSEVLMEHMKVKGVDNVLSEHISLTARSNQKWRTEVFTRPGTALLMIYDGAVTASGANGTNKSSYPKELSTANSIAFMRTFAQKGGGNLHDYYKYCGIAHSNEVNCDHYRGEASGLARGQEVDVERLSGHIVALSSNEGHGGEFYHFDYFPVNGTIPDELFKTNTLAIRIPALLSPADSKTFTERKEAMESAWKSRPKTR